VKAVPSVEGAFTALFGMGKGGSRLR